MQKVKKSFIVIPITLVSIIICFSVVIYFFNSFIKINHVPRKFGATYMTMDNPYFNVLNSAIEEVVESNGDILITRDPAQNQQKQNEQILDMLNMGVEFIFINPVDVDKISPALEICHERNVPFIVVDTNIANSKLAVSVIQSDNYDAGCQIGYDVCKKKTKANIVVLYDKGIVSTATRLRGFLDVLDNSAIDYKIVYMTSNTTLFQPSMILMQQFLEKNIDFDVVIGCNDPAALGALAAIQKKHINKPLLIYGIDGSPDGKNMVEQNLMEGTSAQYPKIMGKMAADLAYKYINGEYINHDVTIPVTLITKENLPMFEVLGWQ